MEKLYASVTLSAPSSWTSTATAAHIRGTSTARGRRSTTRGQKREMTGPITELINPVGKARKQASRILNILHQIKGLGCLDWVFHPTVLVMPNNCQTSAESNYLSNRNAKRFHFVSNPLQCNIWQCSGDSFEPKWDQWKNRCGATEISEKCSKREGTGKSLQPNLQVTVAEEVDVVPPADTTHVL